MQLYRYILLVVDRCNNPLPTSFDLSMSVNPTFAVEISMLSVIVWVTALLFPVVIKITFFELAMVDSPRFALEKTHLPFC